MLHIRHVSRAQHGAPKWGRWLAIGGFEHVTFTSKSQDICGLKTTGPLTVTLSLGRFLTNWMVFVTWNPVRRPQAKIPSERDVFSGLRFNSISVFPTINFALTCAGFCCYSAKHILIWETNLEHFCRLRIVLFVKSRDLHASARIVWWK